MTSPCPVLGVVPVLASPLQVLIAILPAIAASVAGLLLSLFRPAVLRGGIRLAWRLKVPLAVLILAIAGLRWGLMTALRSGGRRPTPVADGAAGDWPMFRGGLARLGSVAGSPEPERGPVNWAFREDKVEFLSSPAASGGRVYVAGSVMSVFGPGRGAIYCLDAASGEALWKAAPDGYLPTFSSPVVAGSRLVCGEGLHDTREARVVCLDLAPGREGELLWSHTTASHVECTPTVSGDRVFVGAGDDGYYCLAQEAGSNRTARVLWHKDGREYPDAETALAVGGDRVYVGLGNGGKAICALDAESGRELGRVATPYPVFSPMAVVDGRLFAAMGAGDFVRSAAELGAQPAGEVWCLDAATLAIHWKYKVGDTVLGAVAVTGDRVYVGSRDGCVYALSHDGELAASRNLHAPIVTSPAVTERLVLVVPVSGILYAMDRLTLEVAWETRLGGDALYISSPAVAGGRVYVGTQRDGLLCVGAQGSPDADGDAVVTFTHEAENGMLVASDGGGSAVWSRQTGRLACEPVRRDAMLLVAQADPPRLAALDAPTGAELWTVALPSAPVRPPTVSGDTISMESADGEERRSLLDGSLRPPGGLPLE